LDIKEMAEQYAACADVQNLPTTVDTLNVASTSPAPASSSTGAIAISSTGNEGWGLHRGGGVRPTGFEDMIPESGDGDGDGDKENKMIDDNVTVEDVDAEADVDDDHLCEAISQFVQDTEGKCPHLLEKRIPYESVSYNAIIPLIGYLIQTGSFAELVNYVDLDKYKGDPLACDSKGKNAMDRGEYFINDIMNCPLAKEYMKDMESNYKHFLKVEKESPSDVVPINLLFGDFFDGIKLYSKVWPFWPLLLNIYNLPPSLRGTFAMSHFMLTAFNNLASSQSAEAIMNNGDAVQRTIEEQFYIAELAMLHCGYLMEIGGTKYFVQARCMFHAADTRGQEKWTCCQGAGSLAGCSKCKRGIGEKDAGAISNTTIYPTNYDS
jgi:hypothetical protein